MTSTLVYFCVVREEAPQGGTKPGTSDGTTSTAGVAPVVHVDGEMTPAVPPVVEPPSTNALDTSYYASDHVVRCSVNCGVCLRVVSCSTVSRSSSEYIVAVAPKIHNRKD